MTIKHITGALLIVFFAALPALADMPAELPDPERITAWSDFPLGSWAVYESVTKEGDNEDVELLRRRLIEIDVDQDIRIEDSLQRNGEWIRKSEDFEWPGDEVNEYELIADEPGEYTIGDYTYETVVRTWRKQWESEYRDGFSRTIILKASFTDKPIATNRIITLSVVDLLLPPNCVSAELTVVEQGDDRKPQRKFLARRVVDLDREFDLDGVLMGCLAEDVEGMIGPIGGEPTMRIEGTRLFNAEVPGMLVFKEAFAEEEGDDGEIEEHYKRRSLKSFHVADPIPEFDFQNPPPLKDRPVIPGDDWAGMRLGAWRKRHSASIGDRMDAGKKSIERVIAVNTEDGTYIMTTDHLSGWSSGKSDIRLIDPFISGYYASEDPRVLDDLETLVVDGVEIPCRVVIKDYSGHGDSAKTESKWIPVEDDHRLLAAVIPGGALKRKVNIDTNPNGRESNHETISRIEKLGDSLNIDGREIPFARRRTLGTSNIFGRYHENIIYELVSDFAPGGVFASVRFFNGKDRRNLEVIAAWGEAERPVPENIDASALKKTSRIKGFSAHYHPWYGWRPGASAVRVRTVDEIDGERSVDIHIFQVVSLDWLDVPAVSRQNVYKDMEYGALRSFAMHGPDRWDIGVEQVSAEPATFEIGDEVIDCVKEVWSGTDEESGRTTTIEILRASRPVAPARTTRMFGRDVGIDPDILSFNVRGEMRNQHYTSEMRLTALEEEAEVGDEKVTCVREVGNKSFRTGLVGRSKRFERLVSDQVPGLVVSSELKTQQPLGERKVEVTTIGFVIPTPAEEDGRVISTTPAWGGAQRGAFARYRVENREGAEHDVEEYEFLRRVTEVYEGDTGELLRIGKGYGMWDQVHRVYITPRRGLEELGLDMTKSEKETVKTLGREIEATREEWVTPEGDRHFTLWRSDEIELFDRQVIMLNFEFSLGADVFRVLARQTGEHTFTVRRRLVSDDAPVTIGGMNLIAIEEVERAEAVRSSGFTTREILSPWVPGQIITRRRMWRDDDELEYTETKLVDFDWGGAE